MTRPSKQQHSQFTDGEFRCQLIGRIRFLIGRLGLTQGEFSRRIGVDPTNFSKIMNGRLKITRNLTNRIAIDLGVSSQWLIDGTGLPFDKPMPPDDATPVYDIDVCAGSSRLDREFTSDRVIGSVNLPGVSRDSVIVRVCGDSMEPEIHSGAFIAIRPAEIADGFKYDRIYVVVTDNMRLVKRIIRNNNPLMATLRSANPAYPDIELPLGEITGLYIVEATLNLKING